MIKVDKNFVDQVSSLARSSSRKRMNYNFHKVPEDRLQRMLNAIEPGTYIQPHKHENPDKREAFFVLRGRICVVEFDDTGAITDYMILDRNSGNYGSEIEPGRWHVIISLAPGSVVYEVKDGPYDPADDKVFAPWAPDENNPDAYKYNVTLLQELGIKMTKG